MGHISDSSKKVTDDLIQLELIRTLYRDFVWTHTVTLILATMTVLVFWTEQPQGLLLGWLGAIFCVFVLRWLLLVRFRQVAPGVDSILWWGWVYTLGAFASGLLWAVLPWLIFDASSTFNVLFIILIQSGIIAGALGVQARFLPAYFSFVIPIELFMSARLLLEESHLQIIVILLLFYLSVFLFFSKNYHKLVFESIRRQFENRDLIASIRLKTKEVEKSNRDKTRFLAAASHDLRQPHQAVGLFLESLINTSDSF